MPYPLRKLAAGISGAVNPLWLEKNAAHLPILKRYKNIANKFPKLRNALKAKDLDDFFNRSSTYISKEEQLRLFPHYTERFETEIQVNDNSLGNIATWEWESLGSTSIISSGPNAIITYPEGVVGEYDIMLTVTTAQGCSDSIILELEIIPDIVFYAPNTFTPDDDEHNQTWKIYVEGIDQQSFELKIYNRWGEVVWETHDTKGEWDGTYGGKAILPGVYNWVAMYKLRDTDGRKTLNGFVQVLR